MVYIEVGAASSRDMPCHKDLIAAESRSHGESHILKNKLSSKVHYLSGAQFISGQLTSREFSK